MRIKGIYILVLAGLILVTTASNCKKHPGSKDTNPSITLDFRPYFNGQQINLRVDEYAKADGEMVKLVNWGLILSKVSLIKDDGSKLLLGDGYLWIDFYSGRNKFTYKDIPAGNYKGVSLEFGLDSVVNHSDPTQWPADHPLNSNLTGLNWGWAGGYIFQALDGTYRDNKDSTTVKIFSYHTVGDQFVRQYPMSLNFSLENNTSKTALIQIDLNEYFQTPVPVKIANEPSNHSGDSAELAWMKTFVTNGEDAYKLIQVK